MDATTSTILEKATAVFKASLREGLEGVSARDMTPERFSNLEKVLQGVMGEVGCLIERELLSACDVDVPHFDRGGKRYYRKYRSEEDYQTFFGKVRLERAVYQANGDNHSVCLMEERAGVIHHNCTPLAAELMAYCSAIMVPTKVEEFCVRFHMMKPSSTVVKDVSREVGESFEESWDSIAAEARQESAPCRDSAKVVALGRDGTMVNVRGEGWREAMAGTIRYYGGDGTSLQALYVSQMPEYGRARFEEKLTFEVREALAPLKPGTRVVCLGDGAEANWEYFDSIPELIGKPRCLDFMHAIGHLSKAAEAIFGDDVQRRETWREKYRAILERHRRGAEKAIRSMRYHLSRIPKNRRGRRGEIRRVIKYFSKNLDKMNYRWLRDHRLPIASGIVEASCKSVIGARLKLSGMRWSNPGGQAILNLRACVLSDHRWDVAWSLHLRKEKRKAA